MTAEHEAKLLGAVRAALLMIITVIEEITGYKRKCKRCGAVVEPKSNEAN